MVLNKLPSFGGAGSVGRRKQIRTKSTAKKSTVTRVSPNERAKTATLSNYRGFDVNGEEWKSFVTKTRKS